MPCSPVSYDLVISTRYRACGLFNNWLEVSAVSENRTSSIWKFPIFSPPKNFIGEVLSVAAVYAEAGIVAVWPLQVKLMSPVSWPTTEK